MLIVSLLGEQAITDSATGRSLNRSARAVALVAFLAVHAGVPQPRQRIAALFWPDSTDAQALTNLRRELHHLRQVLADDESLVTTSTDLCWRDTATCQVDLRTFQREAMAAIASAGDVVDLHRHSEASLAAYGGDLLPGAYDDWVLEVRRDSQGWARGCWPRRAIPRTWCAALGVARDEHGPGAGRTGARRARRRKNAPGHRARRARRTLGRGRGDGAVLRHLRPSLTRPRGRLASRPEHSLRDRTPGDGLARRG